jgi:hypothetical protein
MMRDLENAQACGKIHDGIFDFVLGLILPAALQRWSRPSLCQEIILRGKGRPGLKADNLTVVCKRIV